MPSLDCPRPDPMARPQAIVEWYEEGRTVTGIADYLATSHSRAASRSAQW